MLDLSDTRITDAGLAHLKGLTKLWDLDVLGTRVYVPEFSICGCIADGNSHVRLEQPGKGSETGRGQEPRRGKGS